MPVVGECQSKVFPFSRMHNEIFSQEDDTNKNTSTMIGDMVVTADKALLAKIRDEIKAMAENLSSTGCRFCWDNASGSDHADDLFKMLVMIPLKYILVQLQASFHIMVKYY